MAVISEDFLEGNTDLTGTLKLGAAVKTIGDLAFYQTKLTSLDLSNAASLVSIGNNAFAYTDITGTLVIPANVETIGLYAFCNTGLTGLDLSGAASLETIGDYVFEYADITGTLVIPAKVTAIGWGAFYQTKFTGLDLSNAASLVSIGNYAFAITDITGTIVTPFNVPNYKANSFPAAGVSIVKVSIPGLKQCAVAPSGTEPCWELGADPDMTDVPEDFLKENTELTGMLKLGAAVKTIGEHAFDGTKLTGLDLSDAASLELIGSCAFCYSTDIPGTLMIPANVMTIGVAAFGNTKLTGLDLSKAASLVSIADYAFAFTDITGTIETPFNVPTYTTGGSAASFPSGIIIVKG